MNNKEKLTEVTMLALQGKTNDEQEKRVVLRNQLLKLKESYSNEEDFYAMTNILLEFVKEELYNLLGGDSNV